jgi:hypothetical protein
LIFCNRKLAQTCNMNKETARALQQGLTIYDIHQSNGFHEVRLGPYGPCSVRTPILLDGLQSPSEHRSREHVGQGDNAMNSSHTSRAVAVSCPRPLILIRLSLTIGRGTRIRSRIDKSDTLCFMGDLLLVVASYDSYNMDSQCPKGFCIVRCNR